MCKLGCNEFDLFEKIETAEKEIHRCQVLI
jgi:hypothetical protein